MAYHIIEVANTHGGDIAYVQSLLDEFESYKEGFGIKFQPFHYDGIATKDYAYYETYKELYLAPEKWEQIIDQASRTKDVWLDLFDDYGISILTNNLTKVRGIRLQASILYNQTVIQALSKVNLRDKKIILNVAARSLEQIEERLGYIQEKLQPEEMLLEVGFQDYPTALSDSGINKIKVLKERFNLSLVFADHSEGGSEEATYLPMVASLLGADVIEKHVEHSTLETRYDGYSSLNNTQYGQYIQLQKAYEALLHGHFINERERNYLDKTNQIPILREKIGKGQLIQDQQLVFKRSPKRGLDLEEIHRLQRSHHVLAVSHEEGESFQREDFKKATIATMIACRLKSTRLPKKALLPIGKLPSIELCIKNTLKFDHVHYTVLATSEVEQDKELEDFTYREDVIFHRGDPEDVISRFLEVARQLRVDVILRATGDCVYLSNDIVQFLLQSHFETGADYTIGVGAAVGTNMEIINVEALERVKAHFESADYSEYMTWYFINNPEYFKLNHVQLPEKWCRDYRLTLDYEEDYELLNKIQGYFEENNIEYSIDALFNYLDQHPEVAALNSHISQRYQVDHELIEKLNQVTKIAPSS